MPGDGPARRGSCSARVGAATVRSRSRNFDGTGARTSLDLQSNGELWLYRGNGTGGWANPNGVRIGTGWNAFVGVFSPGDFDGNAGPDLIARLPDGRLFLYPGNGTGGFRSSVQIDSGWQSLQSYPLISSRFCVRSELLGRHAEGLIAGHLAEHAQLLDMDRLIAGVLPLGPLAVSLTRAQ